MVVTRSSGEVALLHSEHPDILASANSAYREAVKNQSLPDRVGWAPKDLTLENAHRLNVCRWTARTMVINLLKNGYPAQVIGRRVYEKPKRRQAYFKDPIEHLYLVLNTERGVIVIDPTWQQFVPEERQTDQLPKVLVGTRDEAVQFAEMSEVPDRPLDFWRSRRRYRGFTDYNGIEWMGIKHAWVSPGDKETDEDERLALAAQAFEKHNSFGITLPKDF